MTASAAMFDRLSLQIGSVENQIPSGSGARSGVNLKMLETSASSSYCI